MHELGIVFHIADSVENIARENGVSKVLSVTLEIGEVSTVIGDYLIDCWNWNAKKSEILNGCELIIETVKAVTHCDDCGQQYETVAHGKICPYCGSDHTWLLVGNEVSIKESCVEDAEVEGRGEDTKDAEAKGRDEDTEEVTVEATREAAEEITAD